MIQQREGYDALSEPATTSRTTKERVVLILDTFGPLLALVLVTIGFALADRVWGQGRFSEMRNVRVILVQTAPIAVAALGMTLVIITGGIDLSAGTAAALCATVLATLINAGYPITAVVLLTLLVGATCGVTNGLLIGWLKIPPFIVTLGTMTVFLGIAKTLAKGSTVFVDSKLVPGWLLNLSATKAPDWIGWFPNIAIGVWLALGVAVIVAGLLRLTVFGRYIFAVGSNESTARLCGVNVLAVKLWVYALSGLLVGLAGIYTFSYVKLANPSEGIGKELKFIAAVVIGGCSLSGGRGTVMGTLAGAAIMTVITNGCNLLEIQNSTQDIMNGIIIVAAVTLDHWRRSFQQR
jgi:ribose transport system permease protein